MQPTEEQKYAWPFKGFPHIHTKEKVDYDTQSLKSLLYGNNAKAVMGLCGVFSLI